MYYIATVFQFYKLYRYLKKLKKVTATVFNQCIVNKKRKQPETRYSHVGNSECKSLYALKVKLIHVLEYIQYWTCEKSQERQSVKQQTKFKKLAAWPRIQKVVLLNLEDSWKGN